MRHQLINRMMGLAVFFAAQMTAVHASSCPTLIQHQELKKIANLPQDEKITLQKALFQLTAKADLSDKVANKKWVGSLVDQVKNDNNISCMYQTTAQLSQDVEIENVSFAPEETFTLQRIDLENH